MLRLKDSEHSITEMLTLTCPLLQVQALRKKRLDKPCQAVTTAKGLKVKDGVIDGSVLKKNALVSGILHTNFLLLERIENCL